MQLLKSILKKAQNANQDPYLAILQYRNAPLHGNVSSAQLLMSRRLQANLPVTATYLTPSVPCQDDVQKMLGQQRERQRQVYNRTALFQPLSALQPGERIRMQMEKGSPWRLATVVASAGPRSYLVRTDDGKSYRRNRAMLKTTAEPHANGAMEEFEVPVPEISGLSDGRNENQGLSLEKPPVITRYGRVSRPPVRYPNDL